MTFPPVASPPAVAPAVETAVVPADRTADPSECPRPVGPVVQFALLLVPVVMSCFFLVYALMGWVIEGRDKLNWSIEAGGVAFWVGLGIPLYAMLTIAWTRLMGGSWRHPLVISGVVHGVLALALALSIVVATRS